MNHQVILEKAIHKAIDGGWHYPAIEDGDYEITVLDEFWVQVGPISKYGRESIIFNHDFAKALWGENLIQLARGNNIGQTITYHAPAWQVRLQDMVIAEDPIKYLGENI